MGLVGVGARPFVLGSLHHQHFPYSLTLRSSDLPHSWVPSPRRKCVFSHPLWLTSESQQRLVCETDMTGKQAGATAYCCVCSDSQHLPCVCSTSQALQQQGHEELCSLEQDLSGNPRVPHVPPHVFVQKMGRLVLCLGLVI